MDISHWKSIGCPEEQQEREPVEATHIIPYSYANFEDTEVRFKSECWEALHHCFLSLKGIPMSVDKINDSANGVCLLQPLHHEFIKFSLSFQPTACIMTSISHVPFSASAATLHSTRSQDEVNIYRIKTYFFFNTLLRHMLPQDRIVRFRFVSDEAQDGMMASPTPRGSLCHR